MKKQILSIAILMNCFVVKTVAQELFSINNKEIPVSEFKRVYEKNLNLVVDEDSKNIDKYLDLYINYKLKVNEAYALGFDTLATYQRELEGYKKQLMTPYLQDENAIDKLIEQAYYRTKNEIRASHLLVKVSKKANEKDTLEAYHKILEARKRIVEGGEPFEKVATEISEDPSVAINGGDLGYFSAFKMVYSFEDNAYKTKLSEVSMPFRTRFGYHIMKVTGMRESKGEFEAAHILVRDTSVKGKVKIDSLYTKIKEGAVFEDIAKKYSEDTGTAALGGKLPKFGTGNMVEEFENTVLGLKNINEVSKPFKTRYGWHIVKLLKQYPVGTFEEEKKEIENKVKRSDRLQLSQQAVLNRLKKEYAIKINPKVTEELKKEAVNKLPGMNPSDWVLSINKKRINVEAFRNFATYNRNPNISEIFEQFKDKELFDYFKEDLVNREPEYKNTLTEYKEGLLLFELMQQKIWKKSAEDTLGLKQFFNTHKIKYKSKDLEEIKGQVISDYQQKLEEDWVSDLRKKNVIRIKEKELKKLKKTYNQ